MIKVIFALAQPWKAALYFKTGEETINFFGPFLDGVPEYPQSLPGKPSAKIFDGEVCWWSIPYIAIEKFWPGERKTRASH